MKNARWHSCNVVQAGAFGRRLWQFDAGDRDVKLVTEEQRLPSQAMTPRLVRRSWRSLWRRRLNLAWVPPEHVFLRVIELPASDPAETRAMAELQLEKLSPIPVNQIVWSIEPVTASAREGEPMTVIVAMASRVAVEEFVGALESGGYQPDRLDISFLSQLRAIEPEVDGVWLFPIALEARTGCLAAWWYGGKLRHLEFSRLAEGESGLRQLAAALETTAMAGEIEGWLTQPPAWRLVADEALAGRFLEPLRAALRADLRVVPALEPGKLAALSARRNIVGEARADLLPQEFAVRYRQQFIDQLWMRGLFVAALLYLIGLAVYFGAVQVLDFQKRRVDRQVAGLLKDYNRALELKARLEILEEQVHLKYAALDCLRLTAELLPADLALTQFNLQNGNRLMLGGTAPADAQQKITEFNSELKKIVLNGAPLFGSVDPPATTLTAVSGAGGEQTARWSFSSQLKRTEAQ